MLFSMSFYHKYSLSDLEKLVPYELDIYSQMIIDLLEAREQAKAGITSGGIPRMVPPNIGLE